MSDPTPVSRQPFWREHVGLTASATLSALLILKVLAVGKFDVETALTIVQVQGTSTVLIAGLIAVLPNLFVQAGIEVVIWGADWFGQRTGSEKLAIVSASLFPLLIFLSVVPLVLVVSVVVLLGLLPLLNWIAARPRVATWRKKRAARKEAASPLLISLKSEGRRLRSKPSRVGWQRLPELVSSALVRHGCLTRSSRLQTMNLLAAYVLGERGAETVYLPRGPGKGVRAAATEDVQRSYCSDDSWLSETLFTVSRDPMYPDCPKSATDSDD